MRVVAIAKYAKSRAALDVWLDWIAAALQLKDSVTVVVCLPKTGVIYLFSGRNFSTQN